MTTSGDPGGTGGVGSSSPGGDPAGAAEDLAGDPVHAAASPALDPGAAGELDGLRALAAELAAGSRLPGETPRALVDRVVGRVVGCVVEATGGPDLDAAERAELRELLTDLVTHDPYLVDLVGRL